MKRYSRTFSTRRSPKKREGGQATLYFLLALGIFMMGALAFAFDLSNMWFHRQAAQSASDAACTAGAMDLLAASQGGATGHSGFTPGTAYTCTTTSTDSVCKYANKNGYKSNQSSPGNTVRVSFPTTANGVTPPPSGVAPNPFIRVDISDDVSTFFLGLLNGRRTVDVKTFATCGVYLASAPLPIVVLDPRNADANTLSVQGTPVVSVYGGPQRSIEVNSGNAAAVNIGGSASINLSQGGPAHTGSDLAVWGGPTAAPGGFVPGSTGHWIPQAAPINDPFAQVAAPAIPTNTPPNPPALTPLGGTSGCPETAPTTCDEYTPGYYPAQIQVKNRTAIFDPGIYYIVGGLSLGPNSCVRPSTAQGDGSGGTMFYFADVNSVSAVANAGSKCPAASPFNTTTGTGFLPFGAKCTAASTIPPNLPATLSGNVLLGSCQAPTVAALCAPNCAINYGDPLGTTGPLGEQRGFLLFQKRSVNASTNPNWQGAGQLLLSGTMYFHQCTTSGADTGLSCSSASAYNDVLNLQGTPGSSTYVLGQIVADQIALGGTATLTMDLNPSSAFVTLKASLLQ